MRILLLSALLPLTLLTCKQDEKVQQTETTQTQTVPAPENTATTTPEIKAKDAAPELVVEPINYDVELGKAVFTDGDKTLIGFNTQTQKGQIRINGKDYVLNKLTFTENNYEIKGDGITINATNGNFQEMVSDCAYGTFPEVKVTLNGKETVLKNIKVQDCPIYN